MIRRITVFLGDLFQIDLRHVIFVKICADIGKVVCRLFPRHQMLFAHDIGQKRFQIVFDHVFVVVKFIFVFENDLIDIRRYMDVFVRSAEIFSQISKIFVHFKQNN